MKNRVASLAAIAALLLSTGCAAPGPAPAGMPSDEQFTEACMKVELKVAQVDMAGSMTQAQEYATNRCRQSLFTCRKDAATAACVRDLKKYGLTN